MNKRGLLLTYVFPPVALPEAYLATKRLANLPDCKIDVITVPPYKDWMGHDDGLDEYINKNFGKITRITPTFFSRYMPFWSPKFLTQCPDGARFLNRRIAKITKDIISRKKYDFLITWSQWHSIHLAGLNIKKSFPSLPWLTYFSDPWTNNPYKKSNPIIRNINYKLEKEVLKKSDLCIFSTKETLNISTNGLPEEIREKSISLPHGYDPDLYPKKTHEKKSHTIICRYLGSFYGDRSPETLIKSLEKINSTQPRLLKNIKFEFIGPIDQNIKKSLDTTKVPHELIEFKDSVGYIESLNIMKKSDLLMVIDAPAKENLFLPSKLIDYIGAGRPIIGITPPGTSRKIIENLGGYTADPSNIEEVCTAIEKSLQDIKNLAPHPAPTWGRAEERNKFTARTIGEEMMQHIQRII